jgi:hypothetical protein
LGSAARPVITNGKVTEEARRKEEETAREKKRMRRRLRREEEREKKQAEQNDRNARALDDSDEDGSEDEEEESEDEAEALVVDEDGWQDTDGSTVDDLADTLARQFADVQIRSAETSVTPSRPGKTSLASGKRDKHEAPDVTPMRRRPTENEQGNPRPTPKQTFKTPLREMTKPVPQSWETLISTPGVKTGGKGKATPKVGMTPSRTGERGEENSVPVQGADRALRYLTPRPCHK